MLAAHAKDPNCAYKWVNWVSSPKVQAEQALSFGETPANTKACAVHGKDQEGLVHRCTTPTRRRRTSNSIKFWKTPVKECGNGQNDCMDYTAWQQKWTEVTG